MSELEKAGLAVFRGRAACFTCHIGPNFTDEKFHNTGVAFLHVMPDGRLVDEGAGDGKFKTPTLREVARTGPYMHDGSLKTLEDVVDDYSEGGRPNPNLEPANSAVAFQRRGEAGAGCVSAVADWQGPRGHVMDD